MSKPAPDKGKPVYIARAGSARVLVYRLSDGRFCVAYRRTADSGRQREMFRLKKDATKRADEVALSIANSMADVVTLTSADRDSYRRAIQMLEPAGIPLHAAIEEYLAARKIAAPQSLLDAVSWYAEGRATIKPVPPSAKILAQLLEQLRDDRRDEKRYIKPLECDLAEFTQQFPDLREASEVGVRAFLRGLKTKRAQRRGGEVIPAGSPVSERRRDNIRDAIVTLMRFARKKGYLPEDKASAAEHIPRISEGGEVSTYSPKEIKAILTHLAKGDQDWLPWAALGAFAGMRTSEIMRLEWGDIKWESSAIAVRRQVARKVRVARQVPILEPLKSWLLPYSKKDGFVIPRKWKAMESAHSEVISRMIRALNWSGWDTNALRHSFGSNRLAIVKSIEQVSLEMGNSPSQVREHYNDPKPEKEAEEYFNVMATESTRNLVIFSTGS